MSDIELPRWDLTQIFPGLDSPEFDREFAAVVGEIEALRAIFDKHGVRRRSSGEVGAAFVSAFETVTEALNKTFERTRIVRCYLGCIVTTDARNDNARSRDSQIGTKAVLLDQLHTRYVAWVGTTELDALLEQSTVARGFEYPLRKMASYASHQMPEGEEDLAAELRPSSLTAWARLHGNLSALLTADVVVSGETRTLPISAVRSLANHPDRETRRSAFEAELAAWERVSVPLAAALNGIKGAQRTLRARRGYQDDVEPTLIGNSIDCATLEAMQAAVRESLPDFWRFMAAKARALGLQRLAWYDLTAPVGHSERAWSWSDAEAFISENFARYSDRLSDFAVRAFRDRWIDAEPRVGKEGGAYCMGVLPGISRVMMNHDGSFTSVSTLAHELGHAYHNLNLEHRAPLQRGTPSTLAETASIFCETLTFDAALRQSAGDERLALLDTAMERNLMVVVDIHSRFLFEQGLFERRAERDLTVRELCDLVMECQRQAYGDAVDPLHPYMWAVKGHYYGPTFYNYPYTFGLLFGLGLYSYYRERGDAFKERYDALLSDTGLADARTLAERFDIDTTSVAFWRSSLDVIRRQIADYEAMTENRSASL